MYSVANFLFRVILPEGRDADVLLPSFRPFHVSEDGGPVLFTLKVVNGERLAVSGIKGEGERVKGEGGKGEGVKGEGVGLRPVMTSDERSDGRGEGVLKDFRDLKVIKGEAAPSPARSAPFTLHPSPIAEGDPSPFPLHPSPSGDPSPFTLHPREAHPSPFTLHPSPPGDPSPFTLHPSPSGDPSPFTLHPSPIPLLEDENDMGHLRLYDHPVGYMLTLSYGEKGPLHILLTDKAFTSPTAYVWWEDPDISMVLTSMLRVVYSQAILPHGAVSLHASVVTHEGLGYLFMGVSGTGKSTHSRLWMEHVPGSELLNDDNPIIRLMEEGTPYVFGSPWSGKTPCYKAHGVPVGGMAQLQQAPMNRFHEQDPISAFSLVLPGCSVVRADAHLFNALCDTLAEICTVVKVGLLECLPDRNAALQCAECLKKVNI